MLTRQYIKEEHKVSCVQFELRVECCSIVKTEEGITVGQVHRLYRGVVVWGK